MSHQPSWSDSSERPGDNRGTATGRLRSACDSCHQAKVRCSGGKPCTACQAAHIRCDYRPGGRLGRPKGSKNKRRPAQENSGKSTETQEKDVPEVSQWIDLEGQHYSEPMLVDLDIDSAFHSSLGPDLNGEIDAGFLGESNLASLSDALGTNRPPADPEDDFSAFFSQKQASSTSSKQVPCRVATSNVSDLSVWDSGYGSISAEPNTINRPTSGLGLGSNEFPGDETDNHGPRRESSGCWCLQQLVQLVYQLGDLQYSTADGPSVDRILQGVQRAQGPWQSLKQCHSCQSEVQQKEVFLMFAMSIRILLASVQKLNDGSFAEPLSTDTGAPRSPSLATTNVGVLVGSFEVVGETKAQLISVAIKGALQSIMSALIHLWERTGRPRSQLGVSSRGNAAPDSPISLSNSSFPELQKLPPPRFNLERLSNNVYTEEIDSLLSTLQGAMNTMKKDLR